MSFKGASRSAGWMVGAQLVVGIGQFLYSGVTARLFTPSEFGGFTAALSLQGLLILLTTTGLPSIVLKEVSLSRSAVRTVRLIGVAGGIIAALLFVGLSPAWLSILNAPQGSDYVPLLAAAVALAPVAAIESALLRRERRPKADATTIASAFFGSSIVATATAIETGEAWALSLATLLNACILLVTATIARRERYRGAGQSAPRSFLLYNAKISAQNIVFFLIGQCPAWLVSGILGAASLGQYARASTLAGIPSTSLSTALNRAVQPYWRELDEPRRTQRVVADAATLVSNLAFPVFGILAALGPAFSVVWLGPGWEEVGLLIPWLAVAFGLQVPFTLLASSLEMRSIFRPIRLAQLGLASGLVIGMALFVITESLLIAGVALVLSQAVGLFVLVQTMAIESGGSAGKLHLSILVPALWAAGLGGVALLGSELCEVFDVRVFESSEVASVLTGGAIALAVGVITFRWQPARRVLRARSIGLPRFLG